MVSIVKRLMTGVILVFGVVVLLVLSLARIETTPNGVHTRLLLPGPNTKIGVHVYSGSGDTPHIPRFLDGPVVRRQTGPRWTASWFCEDQVHAKAGTSTVLEIDCAGTKTVYPVHAAPPPPVSVMPMPAKMLVLSDIEGNARFLDATLRELGIIDGDGHWAYGKNHLVIAGDSVDRGREVFAVLWQLYSLSIEAAEQGGAVHVLLGNHDQYMLRGNMSRANREHIYAFERLGGSARAFGADTVIGGWLRQQAVILQAGNTLVTHGGISPAVAQTGLSVADLNAAQRRYWEGHTAPSPALDAVFGPAGLTQYRGYFVPEERSDVQATPAEVSAALAGFGADSVVVGHTIVDRITSLYDGRVHAIDVNSESAASEVLLFENGTPRIVPLRSKRGLSHDGALLPSRPLRLLDGEDWRMLGSLISRTHTLSQLPHPY